MTIYGRIVDGKLEAIRQPRSQGETKVTDGTLVRPGSQGWTPALLEACGFVEAVEVLPTLTADEVLDGYTDALKSGVPTRTWRKRAKTAAELAESADHTDRENKAVQVSNAVTTLRQWATDARNTNVTVANQVQVLNVVVNRLGIFFDRFADLIEAQRLDQR